MKIYKNETVLDAAKKRIRMLYSEFDEVVVGFSGGKDSTVVLHLTLEIAAELNRKPVKVIFIDQEAEWQGTIDYVRDIMYRPDVHPMWFQMPMVITNNASSYERYSYCWDPEQKAHWIHPQDPISLKENRYGTDRFHELFEAIFRVEFAGRKACYVAGVRTEEAPKRFVSLTEGATYKWITWGKRLYAKDEHYTFYPLYDWSYTDVWKYIDQCEIKYNRVYDQMYRHGVAIQNMRISNLHHETAIQVLLLVQEIEPTTWNKLTNRIDGVNAIKHIKKNAFAVPKELPYMFESWQEYAIHLKENIVQKKEHQDALDAVIHKKEKIYTDQPIRDKFWKTIINTILSSDWDFTKITNWEMATGPYTYRKFVQGKRDIGMFADTSYLTAEQIQILMQCNK